MKFQGNYSDDWLQLASMVKKEAMGRCVRCDAAHDPETGYCLTVHHFDGDKSNNARWNLMALCQRCHLSVQARVDPSIPIMFDPSIWAMPYIAGVYEAGKCEPSPGYDLEKWIRIYSDATKKQWPAWAPTL